MFEKQIVLALSIALSILVGCGGGSSSSPSSTTVSSTATDTTEIADTVEVTDSVQTTPVELDTIAPIFTSNNRVSITENSVSVLTVHADDTTTVTYSVTDGDDRSQFVIDSSSGALKFKTSPDFETPTDSNSDNIYKVVITALDTSANKSQQEISVTVTDIDETISDDSDSDYIPDNIEILLGMDINEADENNNSILDGLDTDDLHGDTFFDMLWHIRDDYTRYTNDSPVQTTGTNDLDILELYHTYMGYNKGNNIIVQVVDTGVDADHEDLLENMDLSRSYDGENVGDPSSSDPHGTMVAGIMAARAFNGKGVRGIIPFAKLAGSNWLQDQSLEALTKAWLTGDGANEIAVSNNSWGTYFDTDTEYEDIMEQGTSTLREGKGRIYVFAAGNDRGTNGNSNLQYSLSNRYMIAVSALKNDNTYADYSTPGSNILVSGYSGNYYEDSPTIGTTTIMGASSNTGDISSKTTWAEDTNENYTFTMNGTSAASPTVSASIALVLEACPDLTWRDVKYLSAKHAKQIHSGNSTWVENDAGLKHSIDYGFGLISAKGMINECTATYTNLTGEQNESVTKTFNKLIADDNTAYLFDLNTTQNMKIEWVEVTIDNDSSYASDYRVVLTSAKGTKTTLMTENTDSNQMGSDLWMNGGFRLSTAAMINEESKGKWTIEITDKLSGDTGTLKSITLQIYGH